MNQVDFLIIVVVAACAVSGARRGLISAAGDIVSLAVGLVLASLAYPLAAAPFRWVLGVSPPIAGALGFGLIAVLTASLAGWGFSALCHRYRLPKLTDRLGGASFGVAFGIFLAAVLVLASGLLHNAAEPVSRSALGPRITALVPRLHGTMESFGLPMPKLVRLPGDYRDELQGLNRGLRFLRINFSRLDGALCIHCRSPVDFTGYHFSRGTLMSPRFQCPQCGRTSDGCQTFEGFHAIYGACPVPLAREGLRFDCGVWTNGWWTVPYGPCPVCAKEHLPASDTSPLAAAPDEDWANVLPEAREEMEKKRRRAERRQQNPTSLTGGYQALDFEAKPMAKTKDSDVIWVTHYSQLVCRNPYRMGSPQDRAA